MLLKFLRDRRGNILPIFAITLVPLIVTTGGVVDYSRAYNQKSIVQDAMDSAALAAGKKIGLVSDDAVKAEANNFFNTNVTGKVDSLPRLNTGIAASTITITTNLTVPTYFLGIIGLRQFDFPLTAKATLAMGTLEIAMVLDNSTSMTLPSSKISTLKTAAGDLATTLWGLGATSTKTDPVKIAVVPFGGAVNVGSSATWIDKKGDGTYAGDAMKGEGAASTINPWALFSTLKDDKGRAITWAGCVEERPAPYDVDDTPPSASASPTAEERKTLFVPMVAPDEPDNWTCSTSKCDYAGSSSSARRYNGAPGGNQSYNNYLPDAGDPTTCADDFKSVTVSRDTPAEFTRNSHGLSAGDEIVFSTTGSLYKGVDAGSPYYVAAATSSSKFVITTESSGTTFTVTKANPAVFTSNRHGLSAGDAVVLSTSGSLYTGLSADTVYTVSSSGLSRNSFRLVDSAGKTVKTSGSQSGTHRFVGLVSTSGSQSGTHYFNKAVNFTCDDGDADCGGSGIGNSEKTAFAGNSVASAKMCKYGTTSNKATIASISISGIDGGPNYMCSTSAITPLTTTKNTVSSAITSMQAKGYTNITAGLMWGWRVLSPGAPFTEGRAYSDNENQKIMILMTDGENTYFPYLEKDKNPSSNSYAGKFVKSAYGAWGYIFKNHLGTTSNSSSEVFTKLNGRTATACANAKAAGIRIYTVGFEINSSSSSDPDATLQLLQDCASDRNKYFDAQNEDDLLAAFSAIGNDISLLRIAQ